MKILKTLCLSLAFAVLACPVSALAARAAVIYNDTPARTVVFKHPAATNANTFFASGTIFNFEVYQPGSKADIDKIITALKSDAAVETVQLGPLVGDYQSFTLVLKSTKDKKWFMSEFKKAGLKTIKINNDPIVAIDKL